MSFVDDAFDNDGKLTDLILNHVFPRVFNFFLHLLLVTLHLHLKVLLNLKISPSFLLLLKFFLILLELFFLLRELVLHHWLLGELLLILLFVFLI